MSSSSKSSTQDVDETLIELGSIFVDNSDSKDNPGQLSSLILRSVRALDIMEAESNTMGSGLSVEQATNDAIRNQSEAPSENPKHEEGSNDSNSEDGDADSDLISDQRGCGEGFDKVLISITNLEAEMITSLAALEDKTTDSISKISRGMSSLLDDIRRNTSDLRDEWMEFKSSQKIFVDQMGTLASKMIAFLDKKPEPCPTCSITTIRKEKPSVVSFKDPAPSSSGVTDNQNNPPEEVPKKKTTTQAKTIWKCSEDEFFEYLTLSLEQPDQSVRQFLHTIFNDWEGIDLQDTMKTLNLPDYHLLKSFRSHLDLSNPDKAKGVIRDWYKRYLKCLCTKNASRGGHQSDLLYVTHPKLSPSDIIMEESTEVVFKSVKI